VRSGPTVAVLGAGAQGTTVALELAHRGCTVDLIDRGATPINGAGLHNEGKLHLGFLWAQDPSHETAELVAAGSLRFFAVMRRWIGAAVDRLPVSHPFIYAVPVDSMVPPDRVHAHLDFAERTVHRLLGEAEAGGLDRRDLRRTVALGAGVRSVPPATCGDWFARDRIAAAFVTPEVAVDPVAVAAALRAAVRRHERIAFRGGVEIERVEAGPRGWSVVLGGDAAPAGPYDHVVNALWVGRLPLDAAVGLRPARPWLWRAKLSVRVPVAISTLSVPTITYLLGPFGDMTDYRSGWSYLAWYPAGLLGLSSDPIPPGEWARIDAAKREAVRDATIARLTELTPRLAGLAADVIARAEVVGGAIYGLGETDIDDEASGLHRRAAVGVRSVGSYHSVDPGKYCLTPYFALRVADRIVEEEE
jgi:glycine/D-amino acid oxidase-like deaminating enzyme